jgi:hypothetical protein
MRWLRVGGARVRVGLASDFAVDEGHRSLRPALLLQRAVLGCLGDDLPLIYGIPNEKSAGVFRRVGYRPVGTLERDVKVLRVGRYLRARSGAWGALRGLSPVIDLGLRAVSAYTWRWPRGRAVSELPGFDDRFDALWEQASPTAAVIGERTAGFLRWRFAACPLRRYTPLGLLAADGRLLGYAVVFVGDEQVTVADLLTDGSDGAADDLLAGLLSWSRRRGAASVAVGCLAPRLERSLRRFGFVRRPGGHSQPVVVRPADAGRISEAELQDWYLTLGDEDYN